LRMPPDCDGGGKVIALLSIGPDVRTYIVAPAHLAIHERDDAVSVAFRRSEPNRIFRVLKHQPSFSGAVYWQGTFPVLMPQLHLATPRRTASTVAKAAVTQTMLRRFDVTTGKNPEPSGAFNGLRFWRGLVCCRFARFLCAMAVPVSEGLRHLDCLSLWLPSLTGLGAPVSARSQMRPTKRLTALVSERSTVCMIDELSMQLQHTRRSMPVLGQRQRAGRLADIVAPTSPPS
jgi:hypothetical protein